MYNKVTSEQKAMIKAKFKEAMAMGATDALHAVAIAASGVLTPTSRAWNSGKGNDAFAAALATLVMDKTIVIKEAS